MPDLARRAVGDLVGVGAARKHRVRAADADAHAVVESLERPALRCAVARHAHHLERHADAIAEAVLVVGGKVAQDAATDLAPLHLHHDALEHRQHAVGADLDRAVEVDDLFRRLRRKTNERRGDHRPARHSAMFTGARSEVSKNASQTQPARLLAMIFAKKGSTLTLPGPA